MAAANGRFGASGGVCSSESEQVTSLFALVQAFVNPPPVAKPLGRYAQVADSAVRFGSKKNRALQTTIAKFESDE